MKKRYRTMVKTTRARHGKNCYRQWGNKGGNPMLLRVSKKK